MRRLVSLVLLVVVSSLTGREASPAAPRSHVRASLLSEDTWVRPGQPLTVAVRLQTEPGWHTYWKNPGDSGLATRVAWQVPPGVVPGPLLWPVPERFGSAPVVSYGHEGDVWLLHELALSSDVRPGTTLRLSASVQWLECQEECRPGRAALELALPVRQERPPRGALASLFAAARLRVPASTAGWRLSVTAEPRVVRLTFRTPRPGTVERAYLFPAQRALLDHAAPQDLQRSSDDYRLTLTLDRNRPAALQRLAGVLVSEGPAGRQSVEIDLPLVHASPY